MQVAVSVLHYLQAQLVVFVKLASFRVEFESKAVCWVIGLPLTLLILPHVLSFLVFGQSFAINLHHLPAVFLVSAYSAIFIDDNYEPLLIDVSLIGRLPHYFETIFVVCHQLSILFSNFIATAVLSFAVNDPEAILIVGDEYSIDHDHFVAVFVVFSVLSVLPYLHPVSVVVILDCIIVDVVFDKVSVMVVFFLLPLAPNLFWRFLTHLTLLYDVFL